MTRSPSGRYWKWSEIIALARSQPGSWVVRLGNEPVRLVRTVRDKSAPELHLDDGVIQAKSVHSHLGEDGRRRGDVYLRFVPNEGEEE